MQFRVTYREYPDGTNLYIGLCGPIHLENNFNLVLSLNYFFPNCNNAVILEVFHTGKHGIAMEEVRQS